MGHWRGQLLTRQSGEKLTAFLNKVPLPLLLKIKDWSDPMSSANLQRLLAAHGVEKIAVFPGAL